MIVDLNVIDRGVAKASRDVAGKSTYDAVLAFDPGPIHAAHKAGILRWIHELVQTRLGIDLEDEEAEREKAEDPALEHAKGPIVIARTFDEARRGLLRAPNAFELEKIITRLGKLSDPVAAVRRERRLRRFEVSRRLGLDHPWALTIDGGAKTIASLATDLLDRTEPLARDLHKRVGATPAHTLEDAFAREAREGWPARIIPRWFEDVFRTIAPRTPNKVALPDGIGGASFLRGAADWGHALRVGSTARSLPYAIAHDPAPTEAFLYGDLLALAIASTPFATRKLGLPARMADTQTRILARALFFTIRQLAALARLGIAESPRDDEVDDLSMRLFGTPLPRTLGGAWANGGFSGRIRDDVPARLAGAVRAYALEGELVHHHDEDWFDNPRAAARLAHVTAGPVWQGDKPTGVEAIARRFEEAIG